MNKPLVNKRNAAGTKVPHEGSYLHTAPNRRARRAYKNMARFTNNSNSSKLEVVGTVRYELLVQWAVTKKGELHRILHKLIVR